MQNGLSGAKFTYYPDLPVGNSLSNDFAATTYCSCITLKSNPWAFHSIEDC